MFAFMIRLLALLGFQRLPPVEYDIAYGADPEQRLDVYHPTKPNGAVIFMVHGGAWRYGDKAGENVVENKTAYWVPEGYTFVSTNYRLDVDPLDQASDVAKALAYCQGAAKEWGCDADRFILMGHSAGAHLVSLLAAAPVIALNHNALPWLGTVALDSAAYNVPEIMNNPHPAYYDDAFGNDPVFWAAASPVDRLNRPPRPMLLVASTLHPGIAQAQAFAEKASGLGARMQVLPVALTHEECNAELGLPGSYTSAVDLFLESVD